MLGTLTNPLPTHVAYSVLYYAMSFSLPGKGKSPLIPTFSLLTMCACKYPKGKKKEIKLSPTETGETYF